LKAWVQVSSYSKRYYCQKCDRQRRLNRDLICRTCFDNEDPEPQPYWSATDIEDKITRLIPRHNTSYADFIGAISMVIAETANQLYEVLKEEEK